MRTVKNLGWVASRPMMQTQRVFQYRPHWCRPQIDRYNSKHILNCYYVPDTLLSDLHILSYLILTTGLLNWLGSVGFKAENNFSLPDIVCKSHSLSSPWLPLVNILSTSSNFSWSLCRYHVRNYNPYINIMETMRWQREWKCSFLLKQNIKWGRGGKQESEYNNLPIHNKGKTCIFILNYMCIKYYVEDHQGTNENICPWEGEIVDWGNCRGKETVHLMSFYSLRLLIWLNVFLLNSVSYFHNNNT